MQNIDIFENSILCGIHGETIIGSLDFSFLETMNELYHTIEWNRVNYLDNMVLDSYASATIEGAVTTLERTRQLINSKGIPKNKSERMVLNTLSASEWIKDKKLTIDTMLELWNKVVDGVCENENQRGDRFRTGMVYVGSSSRIVHISQKPEKIEENMEMLFQFLHNNKKIETAFLAHFYFVYIHPFCDGNGRTARILMSKILYDAGYQNAFSIPFSNMIMNNLSGYYKSLQLSEIVYENKLDVSSFLLYLSNVMLKTLTLLQQDGGKISELEAQVFNFISKHAGAVLTAKKCADKFELSLSEVTTVLETMVTRGTLERYTANGVNYYTKSLIK